MIKALADRFAEAFAEYYIVRSGKTLGICCEESLDNDALIKENTQELDLPRLSCLSSHLEKNTIWELLQVEERIGVSLTESLAMWPAASVSGYYFAHPEASYFGLGKITQDQLESYAQRKNITIEEAEKWLRPNLK